QVCEDEKVSTVWSLVSDRLNIPVNQQGLLHKGKALAGWQKRTAQHSTAQLTPPLTPGQCGTACLLFLTNSSSLPTQ
ncbi:UNVERIFIED_CONTAM: hypothetical protein FKN15_051448, partial [Acipenser sinensis]